MDAETSASQQGRPLAASDSWNNVEKGGSLLVQDLYCKWRQCDICFKPIHESNMGYGSLAITKLELNGLSFAVKAIYSVTYKKCRW